MNHTHSRLDAFSIIQEMIGDSHTHFCFEKKSYKHILTECDGVEEEGGVVSFFENCSFTL